LLNEIDGGVQANPDFIGTRFEIQYSDETCQCMGFSETGNTVFEDVETKKILQIYIP
jgi:hypothetical protein